MRNVDWISDQRCESLGRIRVRLGHFVQFFRGFQNEGCALRTHCRKQFRIREGKPERSVASHGNAGNGASLSPGQGPVLAFDVGHELAQKEVAVALRSVGRIDIEARAPFRSDDQEVTNLAMFPQVFDQRPASAARERLLVVAQPVQVVEHRVA